MAQSTDVAQHRSRVLIGGYEVDHISWSTSGNLIHLPGEPSDGGNARYARVEIRVDVPISAYTPSHWDDYKPAPPARGTSAIIEMRRDGAADVWDRVFTGLVDSVEASTEGEYVVELVDRIDNFSRPITLPPIGSIMPPYFEGNNLMDPQIHPLWVVNECFERAGFFATIPRVPSTRGRASMIGSLWPSPGGGSLRTCVLAGGVWDSRQTGVPETGVGIRNLDATWRLSNSLAFNQAVYFTHLVNSANGAWYSFRLRTGVEAGSPTLWTLAVTHDEVRLYKGSWGTHLGTIKADTKPCIVGFRVTPTGGTLFVNGRTLPIQSADLSPIGVVELNASNSRAVPGAWSLADWMGDTGVLYEPTAVLEDAPNYSSWLTASPPINGVQVSSVLDELAEATVSHWGINVDGQAVWTNNLRAIESQPSQTIDDDFDIYDAFRWSSYWQDSVSQVVSKHLNPRIEAYRTTSLQVWQGTAQNIQPGESVETFAHPEGDEVWLNVHDKVVQVVNKVSGARANRMLDSFFMASVSVPGAGSDPDTTRIATSTEYDATVDVLDASSVKIVQRATGGSEIITSAPDHSWLHPAIRGKDLPILRARGRITWTENGQISSYNSGSSARVYEHQVGYWKGDLQERTTAKLYELLSGDQVKSEGLSIYPNPALRLGSVIKVRLTTQGYYVLGLVTGISHSYSEGEGHATDVNLLFFKHVNEAISWQMFENLHSRTSNPGARMWSDVEPFYANTDWAGFESDPLRES